VTTSDPSPQFVAINSIQCRPEYAGRFKDLFRSRARAIDRMPGFVSMCVLDPKIESEPYLVVSMWESEDAFKAWTTAPEFLEGHQRAFDDLRDAKAAGQELPMTSSMKTYSVLTT
jgi:heme-degrading monooxygenase HmoA